MYIIRSLSDRRNLHNSVFFFYIFNITLARINHFFSFILCRLKSYAKDMK